MNPPMSAPVPACVSIPGQSGSPQPLRIVIAVLEPVEALGRESAEVPERRKLNVASRVQVWCIRHLLYVFSEAILQRSRDAPSVLYVL